MPNPIIRAPHFMTVELTSVLANAGIDAAGNPFNFLPVVNTEAEGTPLTGLVVMSTAVDSDTLVHLSVTDHRVIVRDTVTVLKGHSNGTFDISIEGWFNDVQTTVLVIANFQSFFPAPAKILTLHIRPTVR